LAGMDTKVHKKDIFVTCIRDNRTRCPALQQTLWGEQWLRFWGF